MHCMISAHGGKPSFDVNLKTVPDRATHIVYTGNGIKGMVGLQLRMSDGSLSLDMPGEAVAPLIAYLEALEREWLAWKEREAWKLTEQQFNDAETAAFERTAVKRQTRRMLGDKV